MPIIFSLVEATVLAELHLKELYSCSVLLHCTIGVCKTPYVEMVPVNGCVHTKKLSKVITHELSFSKPFCVPSLQVSDSRSMHLTIPPKYPNAILNLITSEYPSTCPNSCHNEQKYSRAPDISKLGSHYCCTSFRTSPVTVLLYNKKCTTSIKHIFQKCRRM